MKWYFTLLVFFFTCSCKSEKKEMHCDDSNVYSLAIDYCETNPIDSSYVFRSPKQPKLFRNNQI